MLIKKARPRLIVSGIGVGFAGPVNTDKGVVQSAPNIPELTGFSFKKALAEVTADIVVYNDVHAAMYGELKLGVAAGCRDVLGVFIGTGIGGAIVSNGKLHLGASGLAGDAGARAA